MIFLMFMKFFIFMKFAIAIIGFCGLFNSCLVTEKYGNIIYINNTFEIP